MTKINNKYIPELATFKDCTGCMVCIDSCKFGALSLTIGDDGHYYPKLDISKCIGCHTCERKCPVEADFKYNRPVDLRSEPYVAWAKDDKLRLNSASGGVFAALAYKVLEKKGLVVGAVSEGYHVRHIIIDKFDNLNLLQGSKYLQSMTIDVYNQVKAVLDDGKLVFFSGTGCQVAGLLSFLQKPYQNLITADLVCAGVPSSFIMEKFCREEKIIPEKIKWRDKEQGWRHSLQLTVYTRYNQLKYSPKNCFFWGGFLSGMTNRWSCYNCKFCGLDRLSDFTLADYWGIEGYDEEKFKGISLMIMHTKKALALLQEAPITYYKSSWQAALKENYRLILGRRHICVERRVLPFAFKHFSYKTLQKIYGGSIEKKDFLWYPYKLLKYIRFQLISRGIERDKHNMMRNL